MTSDRDRPGDAVSPAAGSATGALPTAQPARPKVHASVAQVLGGVIDDFLSGERYPLAVLKSFLSKTAP